MIRPLKYARQFALGALALGLFYGASAVAVDHSIRPYPNYDRCGQCVPNISGFGYYRTTWRQWPDEVRPDQTFPQSIGAEAIPATAPEGHGQLPMPQPEQLPTPHGILPGEVPLEPPTGGILPPEEPLPEEPLLPSLEEPAEPSVPAVSDLPTPEPPGNPLFEPSPLEPEPFQTPMPGPLEPPGSGGLLEPEPGPPGGVAPLDPTGEDPLPGLRSLAPEIPDGAADAAPMPSEMLSARRLAAADAPAPIPGEDVLGPAQALRPEPASTEELPGEPTAAQSTGFREIDPVQQPDEMPPVRADWVSARNPGFRGSPIEADEPASDEVEVASADDDPPLPELDLGMPGALPSELPAEEIPVAVPPGMDDESPALLEESDDDVQSASADAPADPSGDEPPAFELPESVEAAGSSPLALDGFCLYELSANERWIEGDADWSAAHHGRTYRFSSQQHRDQFLSDPDRYAPAYAGYDPVLVVEGNRFIAGKTDFCVNYDSRLYVFSSAVTLARFQRDPTRYATR